MFSRTESAKKSLFVPTSRPESPSKFLYFGDGSDLSQLASTQFKKSENLLGSRFFNPKPQYSNISVPQNKCRSLMKENIKYESTDNTVIKMDSRQTKQKNTEKIFKKPILKSQISDIQSVRSESITTLKSQIGYLSGRVKNLQQILDTLSDNKVKQNQVSLKKCASDLSKDFKRDPPMSPSISYNQNLNYIKLPFYDLNSERGRAIPKRKQYTCRCKCGGFQQKQQMTGIIFQLYQQNRFYQNQISKMSTLKKSSIMKNKERINELLYKIREI